VNDEREGLWKEVVAAYFKALFQNLVVEELRGTTRNFSEDSWYKLQV
jgi:hypothetical protein